MAQAQAPPPAPAQPGYNPAAPPAPVKKRRGCFGCGCGGCLLAILLIVVLVAAAIFFFAILPASAGSDTPTTLSVFIPNALVSSSQNGTYNGGTTGQMLAPGSWIKTDQAGRGAINFPDGSITRLAAGTQVGITQATLDSHGGLHHADLQQESGRTLSTVQSLVGGGQFGVKGHGIDAEVRGTEFEIFVRPDGTILVKLFVGKLQLGARQNSVNLIAGQQTVVDNNGRASAPAAIVPEPGDPFLLSNGPTGSETVAGNGNQKGTLQTSPSAAPLAQGGTATTAVYNSPGGDMTIALSYPGSLMRLEVLNSQNQVVAASQGPPPVVVRVPAARPGAYVGRITGISLATPEPWSVSFATNPPCRTTQASDFGDLGQVRVAIADSDLNNAFAGSGLGDAGISISPTAGGAIISGHFSYAGTGLSGTAVAYAAPPYLGLTLVEATIYGIPVTTQVANQMARLGGRPLATVDMGFSVDRVYGCKGAQGGLMVIEGHR
jgi:FecR-like protein